MKKALLLVAAVQLGGCASMNSTAMSYRNQEGGNQRVFLWASQYSAGIGSNGGVCAQPATTARSNAASGEVTASAAILEAIAPALRELPPGEAARVGMGVTSSVMLTNATNPQTAYANIAYFYLCQISLNAGERFTADQIVQMWSDVSRTIPQISVTAVDTSRMAAGTPLVPERRRDPQQEGGGGPGGPPSPAPGASTQQPVPVEQGNPR